VQDESTNKSNMKQRNVDLTRYQRENRLLAEENERVNGKARCGSSSGGIWLKQKPY
jgi:hypothetical protein